MLDALELHGGFAEGLFSPSETMKEKNETTVGDRKPWSFIVSFIRLSLRLDTGPASSLSMVHEGEATKEYSP